MSDLFVGDTIAISYIHIFARIWNIVKVVSIDKNFIEIEYENHLIEKFKLNDFPDFLLVKRSKTA